MTCFYYNTRTHTRINPNRPSSSIDLDDDGDLCASVRGGAVDILNVMSRTSRKQSLAGSLVDGQDGAVLLSDNAPPSGNEGQDKDLEDDPEEEQRHIEERLKSLRLELLDELQSQGSSRSAGDFASGDVSPHRLSRPASVFNSENSDRFESPRGAPRHLKPVVTVEIAASRFPLAFSRSANELSSHEAQEQYQDKVFELFSMDPEAMQLREEISGYDFTLSLDFSPTVESRTATY